MLPKDEQVHSHAWNADAPLHQDNQHHAAKQLDQVAQYWQRCYEPLDGKLSRSRHSSMGTLGDDEDDENDADDGGEEMPCEYRYVQYNQRIARTAPVSGLPLVCHNCGVSFFSLRSVDNEEDEEDECYCTGECKWSVIMCREIDRRMSALRSGRVPSKSFANSYGEDTDDSEYYGGASCSSYVDEVISCR